MLRAVYTCILILIERTCKEMLRGVYTCVLIFIECTCKRCCVVFIHLFLSNAQVKDAVWKTLSLFCLMGQYQLRHLWKHDMHIGPT